MKMEVFLIRFKNLNSALKITYPDCSQPTNHFQFYFKHNADLIHWHPNACR